jgi:P-type conjugative transfer protein TrbJ
MKTASNAKKRATAYLLKLRFLLSKSLKRALPKWRKVSRTSHAPLSVALATLILGSGSAIAGGGATGGATEVTQIVNMTQLVASYGQQVMDYENQLLQYSTMIQNLKANPLGVLAPDLAKATSDAARLWSMGTNIASSMSEVDRRFAETFKSPVATDFANKFANWNNASSDALRSAMLNAGLQRENFSSDQAALQKLIDRVQATDGTVAGLQALGSLNAAQIQESMKLRDLISQQQVAQNTYLAAQMSKEKEMQDVQTNSMTIKDRPMPKPAKKEPLSY